MLSALVLTLSPAAPDPAHALHVTGYKPLRSNVLGDEQTAHFTIEEIPRIPSCSNRSPEPCSLAKQIASYHPCPACVSLLLPSFIGPLLVALRSLPLSLTRPLNLRHVGQPIEAHCPSPGGDQLPNMVSRHGGALAPVWCLLHCYGQNAGAIAALRTAAQPPHQDKPGVKCGFCTGKQHNEDTCYKKNHACKDAQKTVEERHANCDAAKPCRCHDRSPGGLRGAGQG
jgi:hypothetical protein